MIEFKTKVEIEKMRVAGRITAQILHEMTKMAKPGVTPLELDAFAEQRCAELGVKPAFKGYRGFPNCVCISVNDQVVHSIPSNRKLVDGDLLKLDFGVIFEGFHGDSARTMSIGLPDLEDFKLIATTAASLMDGIHQIKPGNKIGDISSAIQKTVERDGFHVVKHLGGHGIGRALHEQPHVPNYGTAGKGYELRPGLCLAIEPIVNTLSDGFITEDDGWTTRTTDGGRSAHFEDTIVVTEEGCEILTFYDDRVS